MQILIISLGIVTVFAPLFLYQALLMYLDRKENKTPVQSVREEEFVLAQA